MKSLDAYSLVGHHQSYYVYKRRPTILWAKKGLRSGRRSFESEIRCPLLFKGEGEGAKAPPGALYYIGSESVSRLRVTFRHS